MKKLILAFVALAFAFAISSCCDQSYCPKNSRCEEDQDVRQRGSKPSSGGNETPYRWDHQPSTQQQQQERQHRRW